MIHKQVVACPGSSVIQVPFGTNILKAAFQKNQLTLWYERPAIGEENVGMQVDVIGTGDVFNTEYHMYVDTVFHRDYVWHIYVKEVR